VTTTATPISCSNDERIYSAIIQATEMMRKSRSGNFNGDDVLALAAAMEVLKTVPTEQRGSGTSMVFHKPQATEIIRKYRQGKNV
jgi:hypothetical protein